MKTIISPILGLCCYLSLFATALAAPPLKWTPKQVDLEINAGRQEVISVSAEVSRRVDNLVVDIVPALQPFVRVAPATVNTIRRGESARFDIVIDVPMDMAIQTYEGTIKLRNDQGSARRGNNRETLPKPLPVTINVTAAPANPFNLPPDPGAAGDQTIAGVDSDNDEVRDDVQRFIFLTYPNAAATRSSLIQYAMPLQDAINNTDNSDVSGEMSNQLVRATECMYAIDEANANTVIKTLISEVVNTRERLAAYDAYQSNIDGTVLRMRSIDEFAQSCEFDIDNPPN